MRRFFSKKKNKPSAPKAVRDEAIEQYRKTRQALEDKNPGLIERMKEALTTMPHAEKQALIEKDLMDEAAAAGEGEMVQVDRKNSLEVIAKFLEETESKEMKDAVKKALIRHMN